jgi:DNA replication ATP-dependent helicase Dna2
MKKEALANLFYREIEKIATNEALEKREKIEALYRLLSVFFVELTRKERLQFSTLFARIAYACHQYPVAKTLQYYIHLFRKRALQAMKEAPVEVDADYQLGIKVLAATVEAFQEVPVPAGLQSRIQAGWPYEIRQRKVKAFRSKVRVVALADDPEASQLIVRDEDQPGQSIRVQYNEADRNDSFMPSIEVIRKVFHFPVSLNLIDVEVDEAGAYHPRAFVIEPDFLMDVTAIAECFRADGENPWPHLLKKFLPFEPNPHLMIGNIANFFLDELMTNPERTFRATFQQTFQLSPMAFCLFDNREIRAIMQRSQKHFLNLKKMVTSGFREEGIHPEHCYLEPSFYSETYGLQGRLDVLYQTADKTAIVELKSGKPFMPNIYGLSVNHFTQTLLYDLLVRSAFGDQANPTNFILYSGQEDKLLRFAPRIKAQQYEALQLRNQLLALERLLSRLGLSGQGDLLEQGDRLFGRLSPAAFPQLKGFVKRDLELFEKGYRSMPELTRRYFIAFAGFIAREHQLAKTGSQDIDRLNGLASLWLETFAEKQENFEIISHLELADNQAGEAEPLVIFNKTEHTHPLANFRKGDIAVLYPYQREGISVLSNQIFKCTIIEISPEQVIIRLRSRQFNGSIFEQFPLWNLEHDLLDSSFNAMYRGLYSFATSPPEMQSLLLAERAPREGAPQEIEVPDELTHEQQDILRKALSAEDYFLLWGPPGTGKTSMMLRHLVSYLLDNTEENILLLAYTNRAVDEICESIENIRQDIRRHYLRIGSRYSTSAAYKGQLLSTKIDQVESREALRSIIHQHRIIVGTVASVSGKSELLKLKSFDRVIIDEASQILEPMLAGLLPHFKRFILIGDHKQLPAVVTQDSEQSRVEDPQLQAIGLKNLRNSLFERLYKECILNGWYWAYAQLSHQGRMHQAIMDFPNRYFYDSTLRILPPSIPVHRRQLEPSFFKMAQVKGLSRILQERIAFMPTEIDPSSVTQKTNQHEANLIARLIHDFREVYQAHGRKLTRKSIGIITPYRAQIAQIRTVLESNEVPMGLLTIDTVERYQGGARDIILISLCTNSLSQLSSLSSLSEEGVDRKLNVALTRARECVVVLGNESILQQSEIYKELIHYCREKTVEP